MHQGQNMRVYALHGITYTSLKVRGTYDVHSNIKLIEMKDIKTHVKIQQPPNFDT